MVSLYAMQISGTPSETGRLWGRYFEFFTPLIGLAAAPALARPIGRRTAWAAAGAMLAGLAGLLAAFWGGIVLFPWDASILTAFFAPDPVRAHVTIGLPLPGAGVGWPRCWRRRPSCSAPGPRRQGSGWCWRSVCCPPSSTTPGWRR